MKKFTQRDLRRIMLEQKSKLDSSAGTQIATINSPLAKYVSGKLTCVICRTVIKSASVWKVHINSKQHKKNVETARQLKDEVFCNISRNQSSSEKFKHQENVFEVNKTALSEDNISEKNNATLKITKQPNVKVPVESDEILPNQFFDDPVQDAKIRNIEYKNPQDEEWERFQREIKEESTMSNAIISGEQEEATVVRQIEEIDEQLKRWAKVVNLEEKTEIILAKTQQRHYEYKKVVDNCSSSSDESDSLDPSFDWRAKRLKN